MAGFVIALSALVGCGETLRPDGGRGLMSVGKVAPDFEALDPSGHTTRLSAMRGQPVVVYFYPKDGTPGCTKEACAFRDAWTRFEKAHVGIIGVSRDSKASHKDFVAEHKLPFALVADEDGSVQREYGVGGILGMSARVSFLIAPDGTIAHVWKDVDPAIHADEVLAAASKLAAPAAQ